MDPKLRVRHEIRHERNEKGKPLSDLGVLPGNAADGLSDIGVRLQLDWQHLGKQARLKYPSDTAQQHSLPRLPRVSAQQPRVRPRSYVLQSSLGSYSRVLYQKLTSAIVLGCLGLYDSNYHKLIIYLGDQSERVPLLRDSVPP